MVGNAVGFLGIGLDAYIRSSDDKGLTENEKAVRQPERFGLIYAVPTYKSSAHDLTWSKFAGNDNAQNT
jgi:hypothetical protein